VISSGHKAMGAPTSGVLCGHKALIRACYLQNWGIGRAMKVGKEGIAGLIAAIVRWYGRDPADEDNGYAAVTAALAASWKFKRRTSRTASAFRYRARRARSPISSAKATRPSGS